MQSELVDYGTLSGPADHYRVSSPTSAASRSGRGQILPTLLLVGLGSLIIPFGLVSAASSVARLLFPVYALLLAAYAFRRWQSCYLSLCMGFLVFCPFLRRVADFHAGFLQTNPILLAPYVALLPCLPSLVRLLLNPRSPGRSAFILMTAVFCYSCALAIIGGQLIQAFYEPLGWVLPIAACAFVIEHRDLQSEIRISLRWALILIMPIITIYGIEQFLSPNDWDRMWMINVDNASFGKPVAFEVRVFSMMNSPGIAAVFTASAMLFLMGEGALASLMGLIALPLLALTLLRAAWFGCGIGLLIAFLLMPMARRVRLLAVVVAAFLGITLFMSSTAVSPDLQNYLLARWNSLFELKSDSSAGDRLATYALSIDRMADAPWGEGYGANASAATSSQKRDTLSLDSGFLEALITFGIVGGLLYLMALFYLVFAGFKACLPIRDRSVMWFASLCSLVVCLPFGSHQIGESSFVGWISLGLLLASTMPAAASTRSAASNGWSSR